MNHTQMRAGGYGIRSLRARIVLFAVVLALVPLLVVSLSLLGTSFGAQRNGILQQQQASAQQLAGQVGLTIAEMQQALDLVGWTSNWQALDPPEQRLLADNLYKYRMLQALESGFGEFNEIVLLDGEGQPVAGHSTIRVMSLEALGEEVRAAAFDVVMGGKPYRGPVYISTATFPTMDIAVPARDLPGRITGLLWGAINLDQALWPTIAAPGVPEGTLVYLFDDQGYLVVRNDDHLVPRDEPLGDLVPLRQVKQGFRQGTTSYLGLTGERVMGAWHPVERLGWTLVIEMPMKRFSAVLIRLLAPAIVLSFVTIGVAVVAGVFVSRLLIRPVDRLRAGAEIIGAGNLDHRIEVRSQDEIGSLARAFNQMAVSLKASRTEIEGWGRELERKVQERTAELAEITRNLEDAADQSRRRALRLEASAQVAHAVTSVLEPDKLLSEVVDLIADRVGFYHVGIFMLDEIGRYAVLRAANSVGGQQMLARGHRLRVGEQGIVGYVTGTGRPPIALDVGADAVHFDNPDLPFTRSEMALPLVARGRILGALDVQSMEAGAFDDEDVGVLQTLADQIAVALDNARLFEESQASLRDMQAVQAQYTRQAWRAFATQQARTIEYTRSGVAPLGDQLLPELVLSQVEVVDRVSRVGEAIVTSGGGDGQTPASLVVPLELYGQPIGVLGFQETEPGRVWTEDEIVLAEAAAYEIAQVLESARLFRDTQQRAWREQAVGQITAQIRASAGVEDILQTAAEELGRALGVSRAIVRLDVRGTSLNPEAPAGQ